MKRLVRPKSYALVLLLALLVHTIAPFIVQAEAQGRVTVPDGTEFTVETTEDISSKTATEGDPINFKVSEDVKIGDVVVISKGALVKGVVTAAQKSGYMGKGGQLNVRVETTTAVDGQKIKLRSSKGKEGDNKTGTTVALVVLFGPLGLLKKGKDAVIKAGTKLKVYTDEQKEITVKA